MPCTALQCHSRSSVCFSRKRVGETRRDISAHVATTIQTPHSGYHFDGSNRRFFEGWYFKVTLPNPGEAFALIYSIEDPAGGTEQQGVGAQIMGPDDSYLIQHSSDVNRFWASEHALELGAIFEPNSEPPKQILPKDAFDQRIATGYQASHTWHQGHLRASEAGVSGNLPSTVASAKWAFSVHPVVGWGNEGEKQRATAGWLASLPVFEPHWQVMMALGFASGWIEWGNKRYEFQNAPSYAEKNWGGGFPKKWFWIQCEKFTSPDDASVALTSAGAIRGLWNLPRDEIVGMLGLHWQGRFYEFVPQRGDVEWEVEPWGSWKVNAENGNFRVSLHATCERPGTPLRAPTANQGLTPQCKDSFHGKVNVKLYEKSSGQLILEATSDHAAVEVGGGPWWKPWISKAEMQEPLKSLIQLPIDVEGISERLPQNLRPRGL